MKTCPDSKTMGLGIADYYARQTAVKEFGSSSIARLQSARIAVVGTGGVGSAAAYQLASLGVGKLKLIDQDIVEESNLHRLLGLNQDSLNKPKAEAIAQQLNSRRTWTETTPVTETLRTSNCEDLLHEVDLIVDGTDNFRTRYLLNRFAIRTRTPYLFTSAIANQGHLTLFDYPLTPCLECMIPESQDNMNENCETVGVTPSIVATVGTIAAAETAKKLLEQPTKLLGNLLTIDLAGPDFVYSKVSKRKDCPACNESLPEKDQHDKVTVLCGENTANVLPEENMTLDLHSVQASIPRELVLVATDSVLVFKRGTHRVSMFRTGRLLISNLKDEDQARKLAGEIWRELL